MSSPDAHSQSPTGTTAPASPPPWRHHLIADLLSPHDRPTTPPTPPRSRARSRAAELTAEMSEVADQIATLNADALAHGLAAGEMSLWASSCGDADRAAALRTIERDLAEAIRSEVEDARALLLAVLRASATDQSALQSALQASADLPRGPQERGGTHRVAERADRRRARSAAHSATS